MNKSQIKAMRECSFNIEPVVGAQVPNTETFVVTTKLSKGKLMFLQNAVQAYADLGHPLAYDMLCAMSEAGWSEITATAFDLEEKPMKPMIAGSKVKSGEDMEASIHKSVFGINYSMFDSSLFIDRLLMTEGMRYEDRARKLVEKLVEEACSKFCRDIGLNGDGTFREMLVNIVKQFKEQVEAAKLLKDCF